MTLKTSLLADYGPPLFRGFPGRPWDPSRWISSGHRRAAVLGVSRRPAIEVLPRVSTFPVHTIRNCIPLTDALGGHGSSGSSPGLGARFPPRVLAGGRFTERATGATAGALCLGPISPGFPRDAVQAMRNCDALDGSRCVSVAAASTRPRLDALAGRETTGDAVAALNTNAPLVYADTRDAWRSAFSVAADAVLDISPACRCS